MATFEIQAPDGKTYEVDGPDQAGALQALQRTLGAPAQPQQSAPAAAMPPTQMQAMDLPVPNGQGGIDPRYTPTDRGTPAPDGFNPAGQVAPFQRNPETGELRWAVPGIVQGALDAVQLPGDVISGKTELDPRIAARDQDPATMDRIANAAGYMTGGATPGNTGRLVTSAGAAVPKAIARGFERSGIEPMSAAARVAELGPAGRLIDLDDNFRLMGSAQSNVMGPARAKIFEAMKERRITGNDRVKAAMDQELGPAPLPSQIKAGIKAEQEALGPEYDRQIALSGRAPNEPVDLSGLAHTINNMTLRAKGDGVRALRTIRGMLNRNDNPNVLENSPEALLRIRNAVDTMLTDDKNKTVFRELTLARQEIDNVLAEAVPAVKTVDANYAELASQSGAVDQGARILGNGPEAIHPEDLGQVIHELGGPQGSLVGPRANAPLGPLRLSQGTRAMLDRVVGTNANDRVAMNQLIKGEGSWNYDKLTRVFGQERARNLFRILQNEAQMAETENLALFGARTAPLRSAQEDLGLVGKEPGLVQNAMDFKPGTAAAKFADKLLGGAAERRRQATGAAVADTLLSRGDFKTVGRGLPVFAPAPLLPVIDAYKKSLNRPR